MPEKGTLLTRDVTPYEAVQRKKRVEQENAFRRSRKLGLSARDTNQQQKSSASKAAAAEPSVPENEQLADQIADEINERVDYIKEMEAMGELTKADKRKIQGEIRARTIELETMKI